VPILINPSKRCSASAPSHFFISPCFWYRNGDVSFTLPTCMILPTAKLIFSRRTTHIHLSGMVSPLITASCCCNSAGNGGISRSPGLVIEGEDCASKRIVRTGAKGFQRGVATVPFSEAGLKLPWRLPWISTFVNIRRCWMERRCACALPSASTHIYHVQSGFDMRPPDHAIVMLLLTSSQRTRSVWPVSQPFYLLDVL